MKELIIKNYNADKNDDRLSNFLMMYNFHYKEKYLRFGKRLKRPKD